MCVTVRPAFQNTCKSFFLLVLKEPWCHNKQLFTFHSCRFLIIRQFIDFLPSGQTLVLVHFFVNQPAERKSIVFILWNHFHPFLLSESIRAVKPNRNLLADIPESSRSDHSHHCQTLIKQLLYKSTAICLHPPGTTGGSKQTLTTLHRRSGDQVMFDPGLTEA